MILCAGFGTRLGALSAELPKPLVPVGDRAVLAHIVAGLSRCGFDRVVLNAHHRADLIVRWANGAEAAEARRRAEIVVVHEIEILGTAGGVAHAEQALGPGPVLVWNGDILAPGLEPARLFGALDRGGVDAVWAVAPRVRGEGTVGIDEAGHLVRLRGESFGREDRGGDFLGIQVLGSGLRGLLPARGCLVGDAALPALRRGLRIGTVEHTGSWRDVGAPAALLAANLEWLSSRGGEAWIGPGAQVGGEVVLRGSVVGAGASIEGAGLVEDCVVLPGCRARAPAARQIVFAADRLLLPPAARSDPPPRG